MLFVDHHEGTKDADGNADGGDRQIIRLPRHHKASHRIRGSHQKRLLVIDLAAVINRQNRYLIADGIDRIDHPPVTDPITPKAFQIASELFDVGMSPGVFLKLPETSRQFLRQRGISRSKEMLSLGRKNDLKHHPAPDATRHPGPPLFRVQHFSAVSPTVDVRGNGRSRQVNAAVLPAVDQRFS